MSSVTNQHRRMFVGSLHVAGAAVVALALGGFYVLVYQPLQRRQAASLDRTEQLDRLLLRTGTEGREYRRLRDQLTGMKASVAELRGQLRVAQPETSFVQSLSSMAADVGLAIVDTQVGVTKTLPTHSQTEIELRGHGSYASICRFLHQAEQFAETTKLSRFELVATKNSDRYPIQLTFILYSEGVSHDTKEKRGVL